jgi:succinate dehydrogenase / fumarate reductase cytochrome b subunit
MTEARSRSRRLLTLTGVVPLGVFVVEHLLANASAMGGGARFDVVLGAAARSPVALVIELVLVMLPLAVHGAIGLALTLRPDPAGHSYASERLWRAQRATGIVILLLVIGHLLELRVRRWLYGLAIASMYTRLSADLSATWSGVPWVALLYIVGVGAASFHAANGVWAFLASRGPRPSRGVTRALAVVGGALFLVGTATVVSVSTGARLLSGAETAPRCGPDSVPPDPAAAPSGLVPAASSAPPSR